MIGRRHRVRSRDLAALADGSLEPARLASVQEAVDRAPDLQAAVDAQRRALTAVAQVREPAPIVLRNRIALALSPPVRRGTRGNGPRRTLAIGMLASAVLAGGIVLLTGGATVAPTVAQAAVLAVQMPEAPALEPRQDGSVLPGLRAAGLTFPYWEDHFGLRASGVRWDRVSGHVLTTVLYRRGQGQVAYTIASGAPLQAGAMTSSVGWAGTAVRAFTQRGQTVVMWERAGHTCVLVARGIPASRLVSLASWSGGRSAGG